MQYSYAVLGEVFSSHSGQFWVSHCLISHPKSLAEHAGSLHLEHPPPPPNEKIFTENSRSGPAKEEEEIHREKETEREKER